MRPSFGRLSTLSRTSGYAANFAHYMLGSRRVRGSQSARRASFAVAATVLGAAVVVGASLEASAGRHRAPLRHTRTIGPGLTLTTIHRRHPRNDIHVLAMQPSSDLTLDVELANGTIPGHEQTSSMARRRGAIAAINGDYTLRPGDAGSGRPVDTFAADGELVTSPLIWGRNFALSQDESTTYFGHARLKVEMIDGTGKAWKVHGWNDFRDDSSSGSIDGYTTAGAQEFRPDANACSVRLYPSGDPSWSADGGVTRPFVVDRVKCSSHRLARRGGVVLSTSRYDRRGARLQQSLAPQEGVTITWSMGWPGTLDTIGGNPDVVEDGHLAAGDCNISYFCRRNPRTGVGVKPDGTILMVTVDGRRRGSVGMTPDEFGRLFQSLGATWALNMDGGGSTTMVVKGRVVNVPSDGYERPVGSSLLVLPGPDEGEPTPLPYQSPTVVPTTLPTAVSTPPLSAEPTLPEGVRTPDAACLSLKDPASTGGLLDALSHGDLAGRLPKTLRPALRTFESAGPCGALRFPI